MQETLLERVIRHEGSIIKKGMHVAYQDSEGHTTAGYGTLLDAPGGLTEVEARYLLQNRILIAGVEAKANYPGFVNIDALRQGIIVEMVFQLGMDGVLEFHDMIAATQAGNYSAAANAMLASAWDKETPSRVVELSDLMRGSLVAA